MDGANDDGGPGYGNSGGRGRGHNQDIIWHIASGGGDLLGAWRNPNPNLVVWGGGKRQTTPKQCGILSYFFSSDLGLVLNYHTRHQRGPLAASEFNCAAVRARPNYGDGA